MHKSGVKLVLGGLLITAAMGGAAAAQYQPIPNFTGIGAGFNFRQSINQRFSGAAAISPQFVNLPFASLPAEQDGLLLWCKDCQATAPCTSGGAGAWARGARGAWSCASGPLEQDLNANGHNIVSAAGVRAQRSGDAQNRELLAPGTGVQVGNGSAAPFTAIDEQANLAGHVNGQINVKAPPYLARGDGVTDDTGAIQAAINAGCASAGKHPEVYLPATPGGLSYKITSPLLIDCNIRFTGAGWQQSAISQNFFGPTIVAQAAESGWKPPLTTSIGVTWQASHNYAQWQDIRDSNGNIEVQEAAACTSGSGAHPNWPTTQPNTVADGSCTWALATTGGMAAIASGAGGSLDSADPEFFNGAGYGSNNATMEIMNPANLEGVLNGLSQFTVEFYFEPFSNPGSNTNWIISITQGAPDGNGNQRQLWFGLQGANGSCSGPCLQTGWEIGGAQNASSFNAAANTVALNRIHHIALTYDGSSVRTFVDGQLAQTTAASGSWNVGPFASFMLASQGASIYPGVSDGFGNPTAPGFFDSLRISNVARYTASFTPPTAKFSSDGNTVFLENFPTGTPTGTIEGLWANQTNVFIPIETSNGAAEVNPGYIGNLQLADNGIWATWTINSTIENVWMGSAGRTCVNLANNDFQITIRRVFCGIVPGAKTSVGFIFGNASNDNLYDHIQCDGQYACIGQITGAGHYIMPDFTDRGYGFAPLYFIQGQALLDSPILDVEDSAPNQIAAVYSQGAPAPIVINGGQLTSGAAGNAYLTINGGAPFIVNGTLFENGTPAELLNVVSNPSSPVSVRDIAQPSGLAQTNAGKTWWLNESVGGQDVGVKFADLPSTVTNGVRRYCVDCDPPANPPVACTGAGAKTGAWVNGLNNVWVCVP